MGKLITSKVKQSKKTDNQSCRDSRQAMPFTFKEITREQQEKERLSAYSYLI